jgi:hypothetical protein
MGTTMAPSCANIFMGNLEKQIIQSSPQKPLSWSRVIDDIDMKWTESKEKGSWIPCLKDNQWYPSNVRIMLLHEVEGGNRRIRRFFLWDAHLLKQWVSLGC